MRLLADENIDPMLVEWLRHDGHDVKAAQDSLAGTSDEELTEIALRESRAILTRDKDFGELAVRYGKPIAGVVLIRLQAGTRAEYLKAFAQRWPRILPRLQGHLVVVTNSSLRARPL